MDKLGVRIEQRPEAAIAVGLVDQLERGAPEQDRVPPGAIAVHRYDDGSIGARLRVQQRPYGTAPATAADRRG